jgi:hypothetical protein
MNAEDLIKLIHENCVSIRSIPKQIEIVYTMHGFMDGYEVFEKEFARDVTEEKYLLMKESLKLNEDFRLENGVIYRKWCRHFEYPKNGGRWMAQVVRRNDSIITWNLKKHGVFDTLEEAVLHAIDKKHTTL